MERAGGVACAHGSVPRNNFHMCLKVGAGTGEGELGVVGRRKRRKKERRKKERRWRRRRRGEIVKSLVIKRLR